MEALLTVNNYVPMETPVLTTNKRYHDDWYQAGQTLSVSGALFNSLQITERIYRFGVKKYRGASPAVLLQYAYLPLP